MSYKSILNNKRHTIRLCVIDNWTSGYTIGSGIPNGMCIYGASHIVYQFPYHGGRSYAARNENYGKLMTIEEAEKIQIEKGITHPFTRNSFKFVMSRAAKKRGYTTKCFMYNDRVKKHAARQEWLMTF